MAEPAVIVRNLTRQFEGLLAVDHVDMDLDAGKIYGLIGTNGAGKSTVINMLSGNLNPTEGSIVFRGKHLEYASADACARAGVSRTFQNLRLFADETVLDNVITASQIRRTYGLGQMLLYLPGYRKEEEAFRKNAYEMLRLMKIDKYADQTAGSLPYGLQRRLEIARCLALNPGLLLLDEPAAGMNPQESLELVRDIRMVHEKRPQMTILLIEHDMKVIMSLCSYIYVMASGQKIEEGTPDQIRSSQKVINAYLGGSVHADSGS